MANTNNTARKPAALSKADALAERLAAATKGITLPAANNGMAWLALLAEVPAVKAEVASARGHKYGDKGKGLVPGASDMVALTPIGRDMAATGHGKNGKPNAQAATCRAVAVACTALQTDAVCKAAVVFFGLTDATVLQVLHGCKATDGNGKATGPRYIGKGNVPCPRWLADYVNGNVRGDMLRKVAS